MASRKLAFRVEALKIVCVDRQRSERFYRQVLGAATLPTSDPEYGCPWLRLGSLAISLLPEWGPGNQSYRRGLAMLESADHSWKTRLMTWLFWEPSLGLWWQ